MRLDTDEAMFGRVVGSYRIGERIGDGGMGVVYLAEHVLLGKRAAVKILLRERSNDKDATERFFNEAKAASLIKHGGIVEIFDYGRLPDGNAYIVMEYLEGETLGERLAREHRLTSKAAAAIARLLAGTLAAAHDHGIIHRDLKPDNVFLIPAPELPRGERTKVLDFGIAKLQRTPGDLVKTDTGQVMGTPFYMSPEQCRGAGGVDHRTDLYSLGCVLYQMLTGRPPFVMAGAGEILAAHIYEKPVPPRELQPTIHAGLEKVVMRLLAKDPALRYPTMDAVVVALNDAMAPRVEDETAEPSLRESDDLETLERVDRRRPPRRPAPLTLDGGDHLTTARTLVRPRSSWRSPLAGVVAATASLGAVAVWQIVRAGEAPAADLDWPPAAVVAARPAPPSQPTARPLVGRAPEPHEIDPPVASEERVTLRIDSDPLGATVYREADGVRLGATPFAMLVARGTGDLRFVLRLAGHRSARVSLATDADAVRRVVLTPRQPAPPALERAPPALEQAPPALEQAPPALEQAPPAPAGPALEPAPPPALEPAPPPALEPAAPARSPAARDPADAAELQASEASPF